MCLVPPESLQDVLLAATTAPVNSADQAKIAEMVQLGFQTWRDFHDRYGQQQKEIRKQAPGLVSWDDMRQFACDHLGAVPAAGFTAQRFRYAESQVEATEEAATVLKLETGDFHSCGETSGVPIFGPNGESAPQLGLNLPLVAEALRKHAFPALPTGAAHLRWPTTAKMLGPMPHGILAFLCQTIRSHQNGSWIEIGTSIALFTVRAIEPPKLVEGAEKADLIRTLLTATVRTKPEQDAALLETLRQSESELIQKLRRPSDRDLSEGIRHAVIPLFAATIAQDA